MSGVLAALLRPEPPGDLVAVHAGQADVQEHDLGPVGAGRPRWPAGPSWATWTSWPRSFRSRASPAAVSTLSSTTRTREPRRATRGGVARGARRPGGRRLQGGQPDGELAPLPGPSLAAATLPPCISASFWTSVRPMPEPPSERASERSPWANRSKIRGSSSGGMPTPVSRTRMTTSSPSRRAVSAMRPAGVGVLRGVGQEVDEDLLEPGRVGLEPQAAVGRARRSARASAPRGAAGRPRRHCSTTGEQVERLLPELDLAPGDAGDVQQVVDQPGEVLHLPLR